MDEKQDNSRLQELVETQAAPSISRRIFLRFSPELERHYEWAQRDVRARDVLTIGLVANVLFVCFLFGDYALDPANIWRCVLIRVGLFTPCTLLSLLCIWRWRTELVREMLKVFAGALAAWCTLAVAVDRSSVIAVMSQTGFMLTVVFALLIIRLSFPYALAGSALMLLEEANYLRHELYLRPVEKLTCVLLICTCAILSVITNRRLEESERRGYVLLLREEFRGTKLQRLNQSLAELSQVDGLTGISNRRHFDSELQRMWAAAAQEGTPLSLLLMDLDRFKQVNDTFGHLFGDQVLITVARILRSGVRGREDAVARFGGEEMAIVLARADEVTALQVAEGLRERVAAVQWHPVGCEAPREVTISCGVASMYPGREDGRALLLDAADQALYRAKHQGRNRVCGYDWGSASGDKRTTANVLALERDKGCGRFASDRPVGA